MNVGSYTLLVMVERDAVEASAVPFQPLPPVRHHTHGARLAERLLIGRMDTRRFCAWATLSVAGTHTLAPSGLDHATRSQPAAARQPAVEAVRLAFAHDRSNVLRQFDRHGSCTVLAFEVRYPLRLFVGLLHGLLQHYPCRAAHGQRRVPPLHHQREGWVRALRAWPHSLRLAETLDVARHGGVAPREAMALDGPKALEGLPTPRVPPFAYVLLLRGEDALRGIAPSSALWEDWRLERPHDSHAPHAAVLGHRAIGPALVVQPPDLCAGGEPSRMARPSAAGSCGHRRRRALAHAP